MKTEKNKPAAGEEKNLSDDVLEQVTGGTAPEYSLIVCEYCKKPFGVSAYMQHQAQCPENPANKKQ